MENIQKKQRIEWVDILKGIAIISVVIGHRAGGNGLLIPTALKVWIYSYHMPLFFFLSGVVFSIDKFTNFKEFLVKKIKTLLLPMVIFSMVRIIFCYVYYFLILGNESYNTIKMLRLTAGIIIQRTSGNYRGCLWFLNCLFLSHIILYWVIKLLKNKYKFILCALFIFYSLGVLYVKLIGIQLPWYIELSFIAVIFCGMGYLLKKNKGLILNKMSWVTTVIFFIVNVLATYENYLVAGKGVDLVFGSIGNPILYLLESFAGILAFVSLFRNVKGLKVIQYIGRNSLVYYCLIDLMAFLPDILVYNILHLNYENIGNGIVLVWMGYVAIIYISIYPINEFINKKAKFVLGRF